MDHFPGLTQPMLLHHGLDVSDAYLGLMEPMSLLDMVDVSDGDGS